MQLIKEVVEDVKYIIEEAATPTAPKNYFIEGVFLQSEIANRNKRLYPSHIMQKEVERYNNEYIQKNRAYGELGHPDTPTINLDRVSHMIKTLGKDGNNFIGKAQILDTPNGKIVKSLIDAGCTLGVSSRGLGNLVSKNGVNIVQDNFMLSTAADIVADPSAPDAFVCAIMENKEWVYNAGTNSWMIAENIKNTINKMPSKQVVKHQAKLFESFLKNLK